MKEPNRRAAKGKLRRKSRVADRWRKGRLGFEILEERRVLAAFTPSNIAVLGLAAASNNTTGSIYEVNPSGSLVQAISIPSTGPSPLRFSDSGTSSFLSDSNDGTLLTFAAYNTADTTDSNLATVTTADPATDRAVGTLNSSGTTTLQGTYTGTSGNQARSATTLNDTNFFITDKGGLYTTASPGGTGSSPSLTTNILDARAFGGAVYVSSASGPAVSTVAADNASALTPLALPQGASTGATATWSANVATATVTSNANFTIGSTVVISGMTPSAYNGTFTITGNTGSTHFTYALPEGSNPGSGTGGSATTNGDGSIQDFYMLSSGQNGSTYDILYTLDSTGTINKFSLVGSNWLSNGSYTPSSGANPALHAGGLALIAGSDGTPATTGTGDGEYLYAVSTGTSSSPAAPADNTLEQLTDTAGYNTSITIASEITTLYTATGGATLKGLAFTPTTTSLAINGLPTSTSATAGGPAVNLATTAAFSDTLTSSQLNGSQLSVAITANGDNANDVLGIENQGTTAGEIGVSGSSINYYYSTGTPTTIGTFTGGTSGSNLAISFNNSTLESAAAIQALINDITFQTNSSSNATRTVKFTFTPSAGNGSAFSASESVAVEESPLINAGSAITLGENYGAYSTTLTGINDNENDGNTNVTSAVASIASGTSSLFSSVPSVTYTSPSSTATLNFTLAPNQTGSTTITITVTNSLGLTATTTYPLTVNPITVTNTAVAAVAAGETVTIASADLTAAETGVTNAASFVYTVTGNPPASAGTLYDNGVALVENSTFTQADVNNGLLTYTSTGSSTTTDNISFSVSDSAGGSRTGQFSVLVIEPQAFTAGNIAVLELATASDNTTGSIVELKPSMASQVSPVQNIPLTEMSFSNSGTSSFLSDSNDGSLLAFGAYNTTTYNGSDLGEDTATGSRGVGTLNASGTFDLATTYTDTVATQTTTEQTRSATSLDNSTWFITDKDGLYTNNDNNPGGPSGPSLTTNILDARAFGGTVYVSSTSASAAVSTVSTPSATGLNGLPGLPADGNIQDFYLIQSGQNGSTYDVLYTMDSTKMINKFSLVSGNWVSDGSYIMTGSAGDSMIAENDGAGGAYLYVTTGTVLERFTDTAGYDASINIAASPTTLYTATGTNVLKGIAFTPATATAPTVSNPTSVNATGNSATLGGTVTSTGSSVSGSGASAQVNETVGYGVVYSLTSINSSPVIGGNVVTQAAGSGNAVFNPFAVSVTGLQANTEYSYAAYAMNSAGATSYTSFGTFTTTPGPVINPGSAITLGENYGAYSTTLTGINDGESDGNTNVTNVAASITAGSSSLFAAGETPAVTNYSSTTGDATLGFTLAANQAGSATITVTVTNSHGQTAIANYTVTVNPITVTNTAVAAVAAGETVTITSADLTAAENGVTNPANFVYTLTGTPPASAGTLYDNGVALVQNSTFTQADVNNGLLAYTSTGSTTTTDNIPFSVSDSVGGSLSGQSFSVSVVEPVAFTAGNLAVLELGAKSDNTTGSILELKPSAANQSSPVQTVPVNELSFGAAGSSSFLSDTSDGTLLALAAYDTNGVTPVSEAVVAATWSNGTVTLTADNSFAAGNSVTIAGITPSSYDGTFTITAIGSGSDANITFSYALPSNPGPATQFSAASATSLTTDLSYDVATGARAVGTLNSSGTFNLPTTYTEIAAGDQTRAATSTDDSNWLITDHQGTYTNGDSGNWVDFNSLNTRSFGGVLYISAAAPAAPEQTGLAGDTSGAIPLASVLTLASPTSIIATGLPGIPVDANIQDFYLIQSGSNGNTYDILYTLDSTGVINKFSLTNAGQSDAIWVSNGNYTMPGSAGLSMVAEAISPGPGGNSGAYLFLTTKTSLEQFTDTAGYNTAINIAAAPVTLYTATGTNVLKGLAFTPTELPDFSISAAASAGAAVGGDFNYTLTATNLGPASGTGVSVQFTLPAGETFVSASGADGFTGSYSNGVVTFTGGLLSSGASAALTIKVSASSAGFYTAPIGAAVIDPSNTVTEGTEYVDFNTSTVTTNVTNEPDLTVNVNGPSTSYTQQAFTYTLTASNIGSAAATGDVTVEFTLPSNNLIVSSVSAPGFIESQNGQVVTFSGGTLAALSSATISVTVTDSVAETVTAAPGAAVIDPSHTVSSFTNNSSISTVSTVLTPALTTSVIDVAPTVNTSFTGAVASFSDALTPGTFSVTINWGDGHSSPGTISSMPESTPVNSEVVEPTIPYTLYVVTGTHTYASTGNFNVTVTINDGAGDTSTLISSALVGEPPLAITAVPISTALESGGISNQTVATFTDPGIAGAGASGPSSQYTSQFVASINWGDGNTSSGTIAFNSTTAVFSVLGSHTYAATDDYSVTVTVTPQTISVSLLDSSNSSGLTKAPSAEFIEQLYPTQADQTVPINTLALPTVATTSGNFALTASAQSPSESRLHLSENGEYLVLGGYNDTVADTSAQSYLDSPSSTYRVIGTINGEGTVNTSTALTDADYLDNFRGAVSVDGTSFYTYGSSDNLYGLDEDPTGYVHYVGPGVGTGVGTATTSTIITNVNNDTNGAEIFNNTLFTTIRTAKTDGYDSGIYVVGTPGTLPTTANQISTLLIEVPQSNPFAVDDSDKTTAPYDFFMADLNDGNPTDPISGENVAYVADGVNGIMRYDYDTTGSETTPQWNVSYYLTNTGSFSPSLYSVDAGGENDGQLSTAVDYTAANPPPVDPSLAGGVTGLTGEVLPNGQVELFGVTGGVGYTSIKNAVPANSVIEVTDTGANSSYTVLATAGSDAEYRGVSLSPWAAATSTAEVAMYAPTVTVTGGGIYSGNPINAVGSAVGTDGTTPVSGSFSYTYYASDGVTQLSGAPTNAGSYYVVANFTSSNPTYNNASSAETSFTISPANQTINFTAPTTPFTFSPNETVTLSAAGGASGNAVMFTIDHSSTGTGSINGDVLTITGVGTFVLDANQAGNTNYNAALQVQQTLVVNPGAVSQLLVSALPNGLSAGSTASVTITAEDQYNDIVTSFSDSVTLTDSLGGASFGSVSFSGGLATVTATLDTAGSQTITASDTTHRSITAGTSNSVTVTPAAASHLLVSISPTSLSAGQTTSVTITAEDQFNNVVTTFSNSVTLSDSVGGASFSAASFTGGKATVTATLDTAGAQTITATDPPVTTISGMSSGITVTPAAVSQLLLSVAPASLPARQTTSVSITAEDTFGNVVTSFSDSVTLADSLGGATFGSVSFAGGKATVLATLDTVGTQTITANDSSAAVTGTSNPVTVTSAAASKLLISVSPTSLAAGGATSVTITAEDQFNNVVTGFTDTVTLVDNVGGASFSAVSFVGGKATVAATLDAVGTQKITATDTAHPSLQATSATITVSPAAVSQFVVSVTPEIMFAGSTTSVQVTAEDQFGNIVPSYDGTNPAISLSDWPGTATFSGGSYSGGIGTYTATLTTAGLQMIIAMAGNSSGGGPVDVLAAPKPPVLALNGKATNDATAFPSSGGPVSIVNSTTGGLTITDSTSIVGATVTITNLENGVSESLAVSNGVSGLTSSYNAATGTLTIFGPGTAAAYQSVLKTLTYNNVAASPNTTTRDITVTVKDSNGLTSNAAVATVSFTGTYTEASGPASVANPFVPIDANNVVNDPTSTTLVNATVAITSGFQAGSDLLTISSLFPSGTGITISYPQTNEVVLSGSTTLANYEKALAAVEFVLGTTTDPNHGLNNITPVHNPVGGARTFTFTINDGTTSSVSDVKVWNVTPVDTNPTVTTTIAVDTYTAGAAAVAVDSGVTVTDPDTTYVSAATVTIASGYASGQDVLSELSALPSGVTDSFSSGTLSITGTATLSQYQTLLEGVAFSSGAFTTLGQRTLDYVVSNSLSSNVSGNTQYTKTLNVVQTPVFRFDFNNDSSSSTASGASSQGFVGVGPAKTFTQTGGYGFTAQAANFTAFNATSVEQVGVGGAGPITATYAPMYEDGVTGAANTSDAFEIRTTAGQSYDLRAYLGSPTTSMKGLAVKVYTGTYASPEQTLLTTSSSITTTANSTNAFQDPTLTKLIAGGSASAGSVITVVIGSTGTGSTAWDAEGLDLATTGNLPTTTHQDPAGGVAPANSPPVQPLVASQLQPIVSQAIALWAAAGITPAQVSMLQSTQFVIADLKDQGALALTPLTGVNVVQIDATADGYGWFIDPQVVDPAAFGTALTAYQSQAQAGSPAASHMDLLTVVTHELGHILGLPDVSAAALPFDLMDTTLPTGTRRLPTPADVSALATGLPIRATDSVSAVGIGIAPSDSSLGSSSPTPAVFATSPNPTSRLVGTGSFGLDQVLSQFGLPMRTGTTEEDGISNDNEPASGETARDNLFTLLGQSMEWPV